MLKFPNVATPFTAATVVVPDNVPPPGLAPSATVTVPVNPVAGFPCASRAVTCTAGVIGAPAGVVDGCTVNTSWLAAPGVMSNPVDVAPVRAPLDRKSTRLNSSHGYISYAVFCLTKKD